MIPPSLGWWKTYPAAAGEKQADTLAWPFSGSISSALKGVREENDEPRRRRARRGRSAQPGDRDQVAAPSRARMAAASGAGRRRRDRVTARPHGHRPQRGALPPRDG